MKKIYRIRATKSDEIRDFYVVESAYKSCATELMEAGYKIDVSRWE